MGKSRLVQEFLERDDAPRIFFTASRQTEATELHHFAEALAGSRIPGAAELVTGTRLTSWEGAFNTVAALAGSLDSGEALVVVIDEFPYLLESGDGPALEGTIQKLWDRKLQDLPILLILVGSDLAMMDALGAYDRPLYGRPQRVITVRPLSPLDVGEMLDLAPRAAFEAYAVVGGFPLVVGSWRRGESVGAFLRRSLADSTSPLVVDGERIVAAEFPPGAQARRVLGAIGTGRRTFTTIGRLAGLQGTSLARALDLLVTEKRVVAAETPLSARPGREKRYRIADPYLRFWLAFVEPAMPEIDRDRGRIVAERVTAVWPDYLGVAVEPVVRESLQHLLPDSRLGASRHVGAYWTRTGSVEADIVLAREAVPPTDVTWLGSLKWRGRRPFGRRDAQALASLRGEVPGTGAETPLLGVSASGFASAGLDLELDPEDLIGAWDRG